MTVEQFQDLMQQALAAGWDCLHTLHSDRPAEAIALFETITQTEAQLAGLRLRLFTEAKHLDTAVVLDQIRSSTRLNEAQSKAAIRLASELAERFPIINTALCDGYISLEQAHAIITGLKKLPTHFTKTDLEICQNQCLQYVHELGPKELRSLAARMAEIIDPEEADLEEAKRLEREEQKAFADRFLRIRPDFHGSITITGKLPTVDGTLLSAQIEALMPSVSSYGATGETPTPDARRADALTRLIAIAANSAELPAQGGDRPQIQITMTLDNLTARLGRAELLNNSQPISPGAARRMCCDASIIPVVLGTDSEPLDVGRTKRLFTKPQRQLLTARDQGCAFPSCDAPPAACQGHHIIPWVDGGNTDLDHAVLVCPYHHRVVEPDQSISPELQWEVHLDPITKLPWFTPPRHIDPRRTPRQHRRYRLQQAKLAADSEAPPCPEPEPPPWNIPHNDEMPLRRPPKTLEPDPFAEFRRIIERNQATQAQQPVEPNPWHPQE
ncbi:HNH endonuclease signature motif containing protein [Tessaracoccus caeni]|uniref:HNH endonuclease signature motif containing protein n=1 Tax=Tessaracoccus caeni TaxID=3031239 RepID=UPI0023DBF00E|nr:HNH endonuclease signature motif containing protein [Tessaracoccus caeni]MDF1487919.1 DUF222 domain-containing protein [Tessaracoccus caeni]